jgi:hypothetical protein
VLLGLARLLPAGLVLDVGAGGVAAAAAATEGDAIVDELFVIFTPVLCAVTEFGCCVESNGIPAARGLPFHLLVIERS